MSTKRKKSSSAKAYKPKVTKKKRSLKSKSRSRKGKTGSNVIKSAARGRR